MKKIILFVLLLGLSIFSSAVPAAGPVIVGNGAGEGEYSVVFAYSNFREILADCLSVSCQLEDSEAATLKSLLASLDTEDATLPLPVFKSSDVMSAKLFELKKDSSNLTEVWINQDLLWQDVMRTQAYNIGDGALLWLQVLASALEVPAGNLTGLGQKLKSALLENTLRAQWTMDSLATVEYILWSRKEADVLIIRDPGLQAIDLTTLVKNQIRCKSPVTPRFFSPAWISLPSTDTELAGVNLQFGVRWNCEGKTLSSRGLMSVRFQNNSANSPFNPETFYLYIEQGASFEK